MAKSKHRKRMPDYVGWRTDLLVGLALARLPSLKVCKFADNDTNDRLVVTEQGFCFFVAARGFSSHADGMKNGSVLDAWEIRRDPKLMARVREYRNPVVLFLFDADTDQGRYLRVDTLLGHEGDWRFPRENSICKASLEALIREMQGTPKSSRAS